MPCFYFGSKKAGFLFIIGLIRPNLWSTTHTWHAFHYRSSVGFQDSFLSPYPINHTCAETSCWNINIIQIDSSSPPAELRWVMCWNVFAQSSLLSLAVHSLSQTNLVLLPISPQKRLSVLSLKVWEQKWKITQGLTDKVNHSSVMVIFAIFCIL